MIDFEAWPKTPRLSANNGMIITEKIDGTNACVVIKRIQDAPNEDHYDPRDLGGVSFVQIDDHWYVVGAQSRKKLIYPGKGIDNAGFAGWVAENATVLVDLLGVGRHFGEWWGLGIQRGYGMSHKVFSLFNAHRWNKVIENYPEWKARARTIHMDVVPVLYTGRFSDYEIEVMLRSLRAAGSVAAAEWGSLYPRPEGVIIRHNVLGGNLKAFVENDDIPKGEQ